MNHEKKSMEGERLAAATLIIVRAVIQRGKAAGAADDEIRQMMEGAIAADILDRDGRPYSPELAAAGDRLLRETLEMELARAKQGDPEQN